MWINIDKKGKTAKNKKKGGNIEKLQNTGKIGLKQKNTSEKG